MNREQVQERLLAKFDQQSNSFKRFVFFALLPALLFGVLIFTPFTEQLTSRERLQKMQDDYQVQLDQVSSRLDHILSVSALISAINPDSQLSYELEARFDLWRKMKETAGLDKAIIEDWAKGSAKVDLRKIPVFDELQNEYRYSSDCIWLDDQNWRNCFSLVRSKVCIGRGCFIYPNLQVIRKDILPPYSGFSATNQILDKSLAIDLVETLYKVHAAIGQQAPVLADVAFDSSGVTEFQNALQPSLSAWVELGNKVYKTRREARGTKQRLTQQLSRLQTELQRTDDLLHRIEHSGDTIETPLGRLPVGFRELVLLYPTLLGVAYLLCLSSFHRLLTLRYAYLANSNEGINNVSLLLPLWYDPARTIWRQFGRLLFALLPLFFSLWCLIGLHSVFALVTSESDARYAASWYELTAASTIILALVFFVRTSVAMRSLYTEQS